MHRDTDTYFRRGEANLNLNFLQLQLLAECVFENEQSKCKNAK